jgi:DNA-binding response OmpR family regulator
VHVSRLRHKLGPTYGKCLVTEYRAGYQFRPMTTLRSASGASRASR